jgi:hypothetical protein
MVADLTELLERVKEATGPDREIDRAIALATGQLHEDHDCVLDLTGARGTRLYRIDPDGGRVFGGLGDDILIRPYTASLDAALALVERVLPEHVWTLSSGHQVGGPSSYDGYGSDVAEFIKTADYPEHFGRTPALALLTATLTALAAQGDVGSAQVSEEG